MDFGRAWQTILNMGNGLFATLPNLFLAFLTFMVFYLIARRIRHIVIQVTAKQHRAKNVGLILGRLAQSTVVVAGILVALTIIFPSFRPGDLIQLLGIGSVAIGFAFHDLFLNFLAGILILLTSPFKLGDQILVNNFEGTVADIQTRATTIITYDGRRIVIPNADLFTQPVTVNTAFDKRRMEYEIGIGYNEDIERVKRILLDAINTLDDVLKEPPAEAFVVALADSSVNIRLYWWTRSRYEHILHLQDKVLTTLKNVLIETNIEMPIPTQQVHIRQLTDEKNGNSSEIRELPTHPV